MLFFVAWAVVTLQFVLIEDFESFLAETPAYRISRHRGAELLVGAIAYPFFTSALAEEILFRGLIAKRLIHHLGFGIGNAAQTLLFLAPHAALVVLLVEGPKTGLAVTLGLTVAPWPGSRGG